MARTLVVVGAAAAVLAACTSPDGDGGTADPSDEASSTADPTDAVVDHAVATFAVVDEEFRVELVTEELVAHAQQLLDGEDIAAIPLGDVVRDDPGVNSPWSWHLDPATVEFAFATTEVCDGLPSFVEDGTVTSDQYCPWSAEIVSLEQMP
ncbi:hypothetical protein [Beutenbergia cavernae]|nr:hypothetical protein [Beutenbergia cavernae]